MNIIKVQIIRFLFHMTFGKLKEKYKKQWLEIKDKIKKEKNRRPFIELSSQLLELKNNTFYKSLSVK